MAKCDQCGRDENMPYQCGYCGGTYCGEHRLPENHDCPGLEEWNDPEGVFDSGFDDSIQTERGSGGVLDRLAFDTGVGGLSGYFRGNMTYVFLAVMWLTFVLQVVVLGAGMPGLYRDLFVLSTDHPEYVWTWVTSVFAHSPAGSPIPWHIVGNSIVIFFFGRIVERAVGSREYAALFLASGVLAGLGQVGILFLQGIDGGVLGASGAGLAIMATLTVLNPDLTVMLVIPPIPVPIWVITAFYAGLSVLGMIGPVAGGLANGAHLIGLLIGLWYGQRVKGRIDPPRQLQFGGGPGGPGGGRRRF